MKTNQVNRIYIESVRFVKDVWQLKHSKNILLKKYFWKLMFLVNGPEILFWGSHTEIEGSSLFLKLFSIYSSRKRKHKLLYKTSRDVDTGNTIGRFFIHEWCDEWLSISMRIVSSAGYYYISINAIYLYMIKYKGNIPLFSHSSSS